VSAADTAGLGLISTGCPELEVIDLSMVRSTDDFLLKARRALVRPR